MNNTKASQYLLNEEQITDTEIDTLYSLVTNLKLRFGDFKKYDAEYRSLETVNTQESESRRKELLDLCMPILTEVIEDLEEMLQNAEDIKNLFFKAHAALEEKLEQEA